MRPTTDSGLSSAGRNVCLFHRTVYKGMQKPIYLDYQATTPVDPRVFEAMMPYFVERFGNPASKNHSFGWTAEAAVQRAREQVALSITATPAEIIFTSGASEANNLAIKGVAGSYQSKGKRIITVATEHSSVLDTCGYLQRTGFEIIYLPVDSFGYIDLGRLESYLDSSTILVSVMFANNEIGTLQPIAGIGALCRSRGILFHCDATQALGTMDVDVGDLRIDLLSMSAHKIYGPKGVGALYMRQAKPRIHLVPLFHGGGHERGLRSGSLNVPGIVGFGQACAIAQQERQEMVEKLRQYAANLIEAMTSRVPGCWQNGDPVQRLPGNLHFGIDGIHADALMKQLPNLAFSTGSACSTGMPGPSHVLKAIGLTKEMAESSFRVSLGRFTDEKEIAYVSTALPAAVEELRRRML